jgi:DNA-binding transcriptional LysR family regulator
MAVLASPLIENSSIWTFPIMNIDYTLVGGPGFSELKNGVYELRDLMEYPFICMEKGMSVRMYADKMAQNAGAVLHPECEVGSMPLLISMVQVNLGLGFAPAPHVQSALKAGTLFSIRLRQELPQESICLLTSGTMPYNMLTTHFLGMLMN